MTVAPITSPYLVVDDFMPADTAHEMRAAVEAHFGSPYRHTPQSHMTWNYWHVPGLYTYLRTLPEKVIGADLTEAFQTRVCEWSTDMLGLAAAKVSYLSLYVNGCRQDQHNDSLNGRFGFVYSLTKNSRKTSGGKTLIWREDDYFDTRIHRPCSGGDFYDSIEPRFNRLLVFDDRIPHAVQLVEGNMDPLEGRLVLHGHIRESGPVVQGPLLREIVGEAANRLASTYARNLGSALAIYHGPAAIRFTVQPNGAVEDAHLILDRVKRFRGDGPGVREMLGELVNRVSELQFPHWEAPTKVTLPFMFGYP